MRSLASGAAAALAGPNPAVALLVEMDLTVPLFLNQSRLNLVVGGNTYIGTAGLGQIQAITENSAEVPKLSFQIAGVPSTMVALALTEPVQGKAVRIKLTVFDRTTGAVLDTKLRYAGWLDTMSISDGRDGAAISITSESATLDLLRPVGMFYTDADQRQLVPGDLSMQFLNDQIEQRVVWPASTFFKK